MSLAELGLSETIKVEHVFTFNFGDKLERPLRKVAESFIELGYVWAESFRIMAFGMSACFVLIGLARLVEATKTSGDASEKSRLSKPKSSSSSSTSSSRDKSKSKHEGAPSGTSSTTVAEE
eukprot:Nitzschia sp. Nitz4//scaffold32_size149145//144068//144430//NITZ4_002905-RA/size149145-processed-gene-0.79-mRNA-1//1//CDS//3329548147//2301//frame0